MTEGEIQMIASLPVIHRLRFLRQQANGIIDIAEHCELDPIEWRQIRQMLNKVHAVIMHRKNRLIASAVKEVLDRDKQEDTNVSDGE